MSEPDRTRQREHWQAIAEQLGLAPEPEAGSESRPEQLPVKAEAEKPPEPPAPIAKPSQFSAEERPPRRGRRGRPAAAPDSSARAEPKPPPIEKSAVKQIGARPSPPAEESPVPRRGRRRPAARASAAAETDAAEPSSGAVLSHEEKTENQATELRKRRGRGRGRQQRAGGAKPKERTATEEDTSAKIETPQESEEAELDDVRSLSNWNVPSWNELIASLYRPDR
jgi:hypothetical protein